MKNLIDCQSFQLLSFQMSLRPRSGRSIFFLLIASCLAGSFFANLVAEDGSNDKPKLTDPRDQALDLHLDPNKVVGVDACSKCHANEIQVWRATPHSETFFTLHRKKEAQQIANRLNIASFKTDAKCIQCHYTVQQNADRLDVISGVSCESCHGAAKDWLAIHNDYGGPSIGKTDETDQHRLSRLTESIQAGMRNPVNVYLVAQSCYRCHTVPDEELVDVGGHSAGSLDFELVSWSQGSVRHRFMDSDGRNNDLATPERLRLLFISGMIADLEFSLRATAKATQKSTFATTVASRSHRAAKRLRSIYEKTDLTLLREIIEIYRDLELKLNNEAQLIQAADQIHTIGVAFAEESNGSELEVIDPFIPEFSRWK